jgi:large subunit ribosomal protein L19
VNVIDLLKREQEKQQVPILRSGDTVRVHVKVVEGTRERIQVFEGVVIALKGKVGLATSFTVRRIAHGVGVERTFLVHAPRIDKIEVLRHGQVRRAKLFYLREKVGRHARIRERRQPIGGPEMTLLRAEPEAVTDADIDQDEVDETPGDLAAGDRTPEQLPPARPLKDRVGHAGEVAALTYLKEQGFRILARDWRSRLGQIDIVAEDGDTLVLIEVKARRGVGFGTPEEAVDERKQRKLRMLLELYRAQTHRQKQPCRIDVIGLLMDGAMTVTKTEHIRDAVQGD